MVSRTSTRQASWELRSETLPSGWQVLRSGKLGILQVGALGTFPWLVHGFSTRLGGSSRLGDSCVLNLGYASWDRRETVEENRRRFLKTLGVARMKLVTLRQIHSGIVHTLTAVPRKPLGGDALVTAVPNRLLTVETADCVPILLADVRRRIVAAIHAGWRGTLARVAEKAVGHLLMGFGTDPADLVAAIGPAIGPCCYEVGPEVVQAYLGQFAGAKKWFTGPLAESVNPDGSAPFDWLKRELPGREPPRSRPHLDLLTANRHQLIAGGVLRERIFSAGLCTACHPRWLFSYRRDGPRVGRLMAVIGLRG